MKLSPSLSWLDRCHSPQEALVGCVRRSLVYPLYRNWSITQRVVQDVREIFSLGKRAVLQVLLRVRSLFEYSEMHHYLARLYLDDYCVWAQTLRKGQVRSLSQYLEGTVITRELTGWNLSKVEDLASHAFEEGEELDWSQL
eukprot:TRINITY_DN1632_c0_g2_i1.p1 TRINITY_DN1632_c0_g2~~TRINITY_DN1632_c0_g2_i1.p1  ORF type:complete len:141 (+),score=10.81 TRINITY_DN1632_c0_g2_i1:113-535(+)